MRIIINRFMVGTLIRWLRYVFLGISLLLPSLYVAVSDVSSGDGTNGTDAERGSF